MEREPRDLCQLRIGAGRHVLGRAKPRVLASGLGLDLISVRLRPVAGSWQGAPMKPQTLMALALAAGCGSGPPDKLSDAYMDTFRRYCDLVFSCADQYDPNSHGGRELLDYAGGQDANACFDAIRQNFLQANGQEYLDALDASVEAGRIKYNPTAYQECADLYLRQSCDQLLDQHGQSYREPEVCRAVKAGQAAPGEACTIDDDCAAGFCSDAACSKPGPTSR